MKFLNLLFLSQPKFNSPQKINERETATTMRRKKSIWETFFRFQVFLLRKFYFYVPCISLSLSLFMPLQPHELNFQDFISFLFFSFSFPNFHLSLRSLPFPTLFAYFLASSLPLPPHSLFLSYRVESKLNIIDGAASDYMWQWQTCKRCHFPISLRDWSVGG